MVFLRTNYSLMIPAKTALSQLKEERGLCPNKLFNIAGTFHLDFKEPTAHRPITINIPGRRRLFIQSQASLAFSTTR
jgi:hypothetical protein